MALQPTSAMRGFLPVGNSIQIIWFGAGHFNNTHEEMKARRFGARYAFEGYQVL